MNSTRKTKPDEVPILFSGEMVRALLADRKWMTRRICPVQPKLLDGLWQAIYPWGEGGHGIYDTEAEMRAEYDRLMLARCPYRPGRTAWAREMLRLHDSGQRSEAWRYAADDALILIPHGDPRVPAMLSWAHHKEGSTCVSIHMPRWASRIQREIIARRIERVQDITEDDARAEGIRQFTKDGTLMKYWPCDPADGQWKCAWADLPRTARDAFRVLWDQINGKTAPWASNPLVRVITFARAS